MWISVTVLSIYQYQKIIAPAPTANQAPSPVTPVPPAAMVSHETPVLVDLFLGHG